MNSTYTALSEGTRHDVTVEFVTRRAVARDGERVHRLLVEDSAGEQFAVLLAPDSDPLLDVKTGGTYRIDGLLVCEPVGDAADAGADCPDCGEPLRTGTPLDTVDSSVATAADELELEATFGVADDRTSIERVRTDGRGVDDWQPAQSDSRVDTPDCVCPECGRRVDEPDLHGAGFDACVESPAAGANHAPASTPATETVGLAAGGAKDATNFRENVANGYTPQPEALSDEGLFYDYHFETGERADSDALFAPRYATAASTHPLTGETERYLSVGLDSTLSAAAFERPRLDLVAVLDVSGSMDSPFNEYYYDEHGRRRDAGADAGASSGDAPDDERRDTTKLDAATRSLCALTEQLNEDDRLGVVLYNHRAHVAKPLRDVGSTDMAAIRRHVREVAAGGSTNLADGFEAAVDMLSGERGNGPSDARRADPGVERRVVFMTDMMPNVGPAGDGELTDLFADAAVDGVHTTFVGVGLDANAELTEALSGVRGANHYFVNSAAEFERRLGEEFDHVVTPLVYDLSLDLQADGYEVAAVHGSPSAEPAMDQLVHVGTLFPSAKRDGEARGGVVLARLEATADAPAADALGEVDLVASWTDRAGREHAERVTVALPDEPETFAHTGVRKAVALSRYARELRAWAGEVRRRANGGVDDWRLAEDRSVHERGSVPLFVPQDRADRFRRLREHLAGELDAVGDDSLRQELDLLETLRQARPETAGAMPE